MHCIAPLLLGQHEQQTRPELLEDKPLPAHRAHTVPKLERRIQKLTLAVQKQHQAWANW